MTLREVFYSPPADALGDWLYLPGDPSSWTLDTEGYFPSIDPDSGEADLPAEYSSRGYREILDLPTIEDIVQGADRLAGRSDDTVRLEAFIYYFRFDAFLPRIGAPDPPPWEETRRQLDRTFYDELGAEDAARSCQSPGCARGAVRFSVLCRIHHFESVSRRPCPFND